MGSPPPSDQDHRRPSAPPAANLAGLAGEISDHLVSSASAFNLLEAVLIDRTKVQYTVLAPDGGTLLLTINEVVVEQDQHG